MLLSESVFILVLIISFILFILAIIGTMLPIVPGVAIAFFTVLGFKLVFPDCGISMAFVIVSGILTLVAIVLDYVLSIYGAKKFGAGKLGTAGAFLGAIVGIFIPPQPLWIFVMPFLGALVFELIGGKDFRASSKAGLGAFLGVILSSVLKIGIVLGIMGYFYFAILMKHW